MAPIAIPGKTDKSGGGDTPLVAMRDAAALMRRGRAADAAAAYRRIVKAHPDNAEAHHNLGVALRALERPDDAIAAYRRAIELRPAYAAAHHHLALALEGAGQIMESLRHHFAAFKLARDRADFAQSLAAALRAVRLRTASPAVIEGLAALYETPGIDCQDLMTATAGLVLGRDGAGEAAAAAHVGDAAKVKAWWQGPGGRAFAEDKLVQALLRETIVADERMEALLTAVRRLVVERADGAEPPPLAFVAALACQCFANDYVFAEDAAEAARVGKLAGSPAGAAELAALACYRPLHRVAGAREAAEAVRGDSAFDLVRRRQLDEPLAEVELAAHIPALTPVDDATSKEVQAQYEDNPYPRWLSVAQRPARPLADVVHGLFSGLDAASLPQGHARVLVAGCGTGRHALAVAFRYADADILAVDLSRAALAYGMRRARALGVDNIRFRQADILGLGAIDERFDLIEASGVLHHIADPVAAWRILAGLVKPGGFMKLGLYSTAARTALAAARDFVAARSKFSPTPAGIRQARRAIRALPADNPARRAADELDFASASGCRDLLFHVQETSFTLPRVKQALAELGLVFVGFELFDPAAAAAYRAQFPGDTAMTDLDRWHAVEEKRPNLFRTMYQFWCRRP